MNVLISSDWHLTSKTKEVYRWGIFPWLFKMIKKHKIDLLIIEGDVTDLKDNHPSILVNKMVNNFMKLSGMVDIIILKGNHDFIDPKNPFFQFLATLPGVQFITEPTIQGTGGLGKCLYLPFSRDASEEWKDFNFNDYDYIFMHETVFGSIGSNGFSLEGYESKKMDKCSATIIAGDIHVPQMVGNVEYVGSPYRIRFNDAFDPRLILIKDGKRAEDLHFPTLQRHTVKLSNPSKLHKCDFNKGDQIKVKLRLDRSDFVNWHKYKKLIVAICQDLEVDLCGLELEEKKSKKKEVKETKNSLTQSSNSKDVFKAFCEREKLSKELTDVGEGLLCYLEN